MPLLDRYVDDYWALRHVGRSIEKAGDKEVIRLGEAQGHSRPLGWRSVRR